ncbi:MAG: HlyD family efflux transporter periplasmic adaptor subunit [Clostridia bacterium]|nr:HlyD family efflux transporter periplasmic adaptor subunit [Clostridia bacterium]
MSKNREPDTVPENVGAEINAAPAARTEPKKKKKKAGKVIRRIIVTLLILVILAAAGFYAWSRLKDQYTVTYQAYTATIGTISNSLSFSGTLQAVNTQDATANGQTTVRNMYVSEGDKVKAGTRLARLANGQVLEADFDGTVNQVLYAAGDSVAAGATVIQLVDFDHMKVSIRVDEYDIGNVHTGDVCRVTTTATEKVFDSSVASINYVSSSTGNVAYYTATAYVDVDEGCYPGMQVTVTVPRNEATDVVILKADALSFDELNNAFVYVRDDEDQVTEKPVVIGVSNGNYVEIREGLQNGDEVYSEVKVETNTAAGLLMNLFGGRNFMGGGRNNTNNNNRNGQQNNWGSFGGGNGTNRTGGGNSGNPGGGRPGN